MHSQPAEPLQARASIGGLALLATAVTAYVGIRLWHLTRYSLWGGETFGVVGARLSWSGMMDYVIEDIAHPPLFYVVLKIWMLIGGESLLWLKLLPVTFAAITLIPLLLLCRELRMPQSATTLAVMLAAFNGFLIHYSQEVRGYSLMVFFGVASAWLFVRWLNDENRRAAALGAVFAANLLLIYTHYYGWLVVVAQGAFLLFWARSRLRSFVAMVLALGLAFLPWALLVANAAVGKPPVADWVPRPGLEGLAYLYRNLNGPQTWMHSLSVGLILFSVPIMWWIWTYVREKSLPSITDRAGLASVGVLAFLPVGALFVASEVLPRSFFLDRYLVFIAIPYLLLVATAVYHLPSRTARTAWTMALVAWTVTSGLRDVATNRMAWESPQVGSRVDWPTVAQNLREAEQGDEVPLYTLSVWSRGLLTGDWALSRSIGFFLSEVGDERFQMLYARDAKDLLRRASEEHFWVAWFELSHRRSPQPVDILEEHGFVVGSPITQAEGENRIVLLPVWKASAKGH